MQCKDIPDLPILEFLAKLERREIDATYQGGGEDSVNGVVTFQPGWGIWQDDCPHSVQNAMPAEAQGKGKLVLAKMRSLIDRGLIEGCTCGCRGDFELTAKGRELLKPTGKPVARTIGFSIPVEYPAGATFYYGQGTKK